MLITYIRKNKTEKSKGISVGIVLALDKEHIGWSLCNSKDKWNRELGLQIAKGRAEKENKPCIHYLKYNRLKPAMDRIKINAEKYFK